MPELPDVEIARRYLAVHALRQKIVKVEIFSPEMVKWVSVRKLTQSLINRSFVGSSRHGKYLFAEVGHGAALVLHFGMTGFIQYLQRNDIPPAYTRLLISFSNQRALAFDCMRKLGTIGFTEREDRFIQERKSGPDALALKFVELERLLTKATGSVKSIFMNQKRIAGIGNIYADEILFQSRIHPALKGSALSKTQMRKLYKSIKNVLETAIRKRQEGSRYPVRYLTNQREKEGVCPVSGHRLSTIKIGGRTTYFCPHCQRL